jgi:hypothetical protein
MISGDCLDTPIMIPARNRIQNNSDVIMNEIDKLEISDKKIMLLSNPMKITITTINPPKGKGKNKPVKFLDYNEKGRIYIENRDEKCLFYAAEIAREYADASINSTNKKYRPFYRILKNEGLKKAMVEQLLSESNIKYDMKGAGLKQLSLLQDFYDKKYPGKYRLILFCAENIYLKPIWKGPRMRTHNLILHLENSHYDVIKKVSLFFKLRRKYCLECEIPYSRYKMIFSLNI